MFVMTTLDNKQAVEESPDIVRPHNLTDYIQKHHVYTTLQLAMQSLIKYQPKSPLKYLSSYFGDRKKNLFKLVLLGAPGAGKGTQAKHLVSKYSLEHISPGNLLREEMNRNSPIAAQIKDYVSKGQLVPDSVVIKLIEDHIASIGDTNWLLDGFPRSESQAAALRASPDLFPTHIVELKVDQEAVVQRLGGRRFDPITGNTYHIIYDPPPPDIADRVVVRTDDREDVIRERFKVYAENKDLVNRVFNHSIVSISCEGQTIDEVSAQLDKVLSMPSTIHPSIIMPERNKK
ncbi:Adenylate kinase [Giardia duodenalis]|uniref:Adenylate kinase n=2 Tax=Giardia intestinalis TaxID=5741 RepID=V6TUL8_GIAIN|nr:Adenylate kinase [Giardia intestinalis]